MPNRDDGGPAFPARIDTGNRGMTLLDHFAGIALPLTYGECGELSHNQLKARGYKGRNDAAAVNAYALAQAMIKARAQWLAGEIVDAEPDDAPRQAAPDCAHRFRDVFQTGQAKA